MTGLALRGRAPSRRRATAAPKAAGGGGFDPLTLTNLIAWYDASDASTFSFSSGAIVSEWRDKSGNDYHQTPVGTGPERTGTRNGLNIVDYNLEPTSYVDASAIITGGAHTVFMVCNFSSSSFGRALTLAIDGDGNDYGTGKMMISTNGDPNWPSGFSENAVMSRAPDSSLLGSWTTFDYVHTAGDPVLYVNGTSYASTNNNSSLAADCIHIAGSTLVNPVVYGVGLFAEIIICNATISGTMLTDCRDYLADKWGFYKRKALMSRLYTVAFAATTVAAASGDVDYFEITPADDKPVELVGLVLGQSGIGDIGDAAEEFIAFQILRGHTTSGSGGSAPTPVDVGLSGVAAGFTAEVLNTTVASAGTALVCHADSYNVRGGKEFWWPEGAGPIAGQGNTTIVVRQMAAVTDDISLTGTLYVREMP